MRGGRAAGAAAAWRAAVLSVAVASALVLLAGAIYLLRDTAAIAGARAHLPELLWPQNVVSTAGGAIKLAPFWLALKQGGWFAASGPPACAAGRRLWPRLRRLLASSRAPCLVPSNGVETNRGVAGANVHGTEAIDHLKLHPGIFGPAAAACWILAAVPDLLDGAVARGSGTFGGQWRRSESGGLGEWIDHDLFDPLGAPSALAVARAAFPELDPLWLFAAIRSVGGNERWPGTARWSRDPDMLTPLTVETTLVVFGVLAVARSPGLQRWAYQTWAGAGKGPGEMHTGSGSGGSGSGGSGAVTRGWCVRLVWYIWCSYLHVLLVFWPLTSGRFRPWVDAHSVGKFVVDAFY